MSRSDVYKRPQNPLLLVISGPSGVGKDMLIRKLRERGYPFHFVVTVTSRPKRAGEIEGRDYFFVSRQEFEDMVAHGELLEHAWVYGEYKGIPKAQIREAMASGLDVIMRVDVQGAAAMRRLAPEAVFIFLMPASEEELMNRLQGRSLEESPEDLRHRLEKARWEMEHIGQFEYVIVNPDGELDKAVDQLLAIITAEKCRVRPRKVLL